MMGVYAVSDMHGCADVYYKIKSAEHNLQRAKAQFKLLQSIEAHLDEMNAFVATCK